MLNTIYCYLEVSLLLVLYSFNWAGTSEEFKEFVDRTRSIIDGIEGVDLTGIFLPTTEWHYVMILKTEAL